MLKHEYANVNGIRLHYVSAGQGKLLLFVHGFPEFWYAWKDQLAEFGRDYQAVAPDMRGYNLSEKPSDVAQYQIKFLVEDLRALAEHLGHKKFILVSHDWGGGAHGSLRYLIRNVWRSSSSSTWRTQPSLSVSCARIQRNRRPASTC